MGSSNCMHSFFFWCYYYINITFPDGVIVKNIIQRSVIINLGTNWVDNHISRDDICNKLFEIDIYEKWSTKLILSKLSLICHIVLSNCLID